MAKTLNDILKGSNKSKTISGSLGKDPGVDYEPKAKDEAKFAAKHTKQVHDDRNGNGDDVFKGNTKKASFPKQSKSVYEAKEAEEVKCNMTKEGTACPVHGMNECWSAKTIKEKIEQVDEVITKKTSAGEVISDFMHSKNPKFAGKSKEKRKQMALAAYYSKQRNEEVEIEEGHYHVSWGPGIEHSLIAKHADDAVTKAKAHIIKKVPKLTEPKYADTFSKKPAVHRIKEAVEPLLQSADIAKYKTDDTESEIDMVRTELKAIASKVMHMLANMPNDHHIEPWIQSKIAAAKEMIGSVHDYMVYSEEEDEQADTPLVTPNMYPNMANDSAAGINV